jgi:membrane-associated phospholipid phosphatase
LASSSAAVAGDGFARRLAAYLRWSAGLTLLFAATYGATNWIAAQWSSRLRLYFDWELAIPFAPWAIYVYVSINALLTLPLFFLDTNGIGRLGRGFAWTTILAAVAHLVLPADLGWSRPAVPPASLLATLFTLDWPHNLAPSLHVAYSALAGLAVWNAARAAWLRTLAAVWATALAASTMLTHQHHLVDVVTGAALGAFAYFRWASMRKV